MVYNNFIKSVEFNKDFHPFKNGDKIYFGGDAKYDEEGKLLELSEMQKIIEFYLKSKGVKNYKKNAERFKINCVLGNNGGGKSRLFKGLLKYDENLEVDNIKGKEIILDDFFILSRNKLYSIEKDILTLSLKTNLYFKLLKYNKDFDENLSYIKLKLYIDINILENNIDIILDFLTDPFKDKIFSLYSINYIFNKSKKIRKLFINVLIKKIIGNKDFFNNKWNSERAFELSRFKEYFYINNNKILGDISNEKEKIDSLIQYIKKGFGGYSNKVEGDVDEFLCNSNNIEIEFSKEDLLYIDGLLIKENNVKRIGTDLDYKFNKILEIFSKKEAVFSYKKNEDEIVLFDNQSSGEILYTIRNILINLEIKRFEKKNFIILIDEPDLHLHLDWQKKYIQKLIDVFSTLNADIKLHFIIATHSPFIISDLPAESIILLDKKEKEDYTIIKTYNGTNINSKENKNKTLEEIFKDEKEGNKNKKTFGANFVDLINDGFFFENKVLMGSFAESVIGKVADLEREEILIKSKLFDVNLKLENEKDDTRKKELKGQKEKLENKLKEIEKILKENLKENIGDDFLKDNLLYFIGNKNAKN